MKKKILIVFSLVVLVVSGCGVGKLKDNGNAFMDGLKNSDADKTYAMLDTSVAKEIGDANAWKEWIKTRKPTTWSFDGFDVKAGGPSQLTGEALFSDGVKYKISLVFNSAGDVYKIVGLDFKAAK